VHDGDLEQRLVTAHQESGEFDDRTSTR